MSHLRTQLSSFRALFDEHVGYVWRVLRRDGVPERDLEDACHEVFLTAHREWGRLDEQADVRALLGEIAARVARATGERSRELIRPLSSEPYELEAVRPPRAQVRARMFASGPSAEERARLLAELEGALGEARGVSLPNARAQRGMARLLRLKIALGVSVVVGLAALQLQHGCGQRTRSEGLGVRPPYATGSPASVGERGLAR